MGIVISGILATCCCAGAIQQICVCFRKGLCSTSISKNSCLTRAVYALLLTLGVIAACLCLTGHIEKVLMKIPHLCASNTHGDFSDFVINITGTTNTCESFAGYSGAYRICFGFTIFHLCMALVLYRMRTINDCRNGIQNGFWFFKILLIIGIIITNFFWPISGFNRVLLFLGMIGGFLFIIIQMIFLIDCIYIILERWLEKASDGYQRYKCLLISSFILFYGLAIGISIALVRVYAHSKICMPNQVFIALNIFFCLIITIISILPQIQDYNPSSGLVQTAFISFYSTYLVWSSLSSNPTYGAPQCNPSIFSSVGLSSDTIYQESVPKDSMNWASIIGLVIFSIMLLYSTFNSSAIKMARPHPLLEYNNNKNQNWNAMTVIPVEAKQPSSPSIQPPTIENPDSKENPLIPSATVVANDSAAIVRGNDRKKENEKPLTPITTAQNIPMPTETIDNDEEFLVDYSYSFFHLVYALASLYAMMTLTNWYQPSQTLAFFNLSLPAYWIKMISSWLCLFLFLWSILAPYLLQNRDF